MMKFFPKIFRRWAKEEDALAATEMALVFPLMFAMIVGIWDIGNAVVVNQKSIAASQVVVDLICRQEIVSNAELAEAFNAGILALMPYDTSNMKIEVVSVTYDAMDQPQLLWDDSSDNTTVDPALLGRTVGLGTQGDGAVVVQVSYPYTPFFFPSGVIGQINMSERVFSRGRQSPLVCREGVTC